MKNILATIPHLNAPAPGDIVYYNAPATEYFSKHIKSY